MRHEVLLFALNALRMHFGGRIVVADDSFAISSVTLTELAKLDVELHQIVPDIGLSAGRNYLLDQVREDRFLMLDGDFVLEDPCALDRLTKVMEVEQAGIVGGLLWDKGTKAPRNFCGFFSMEDEPVVNFYDLSAIPVREVNGVRYYRCRLCQNFFLGCTDVFRRYGIRWREEFKLMEHEDFFFRLPLAIKVCETPDACVVHYPVLERDSNPDYMGFNGVKTDSNYSQFRHHKIHRQKVSQAYRLKGEFFQYRYNVKYDWTKGFTAVAPTKML